MGDETAGSNPGRRTVLRVSAAGGLAAGGLLAGGLVAAGASGPGASASAAAAQLPARSAVVEVARRVNDHWIGAHADPGPNTWNRSVYVSGDLHAYRLTGEARYLAYARTWAEKHAYVLHGGPTTTWADDQAAGETYLDLYALDPDPATIAALDASVRGMPARVGEDAWWWVDALHMAMPSIVRLGVLRKDPRYADGAHQLYDHTKRVTGGGLFDDELQLWIRDASFVGRRTAAARPVVWSRGNGWAVAAHAKVLRALPAGDRWAPDYRADLVAVCRALLPVQRGDGLWNVNLADPTDHGGPEVSGTALFTYAMAWGISAGLLDRATHLPAVAAAWDGMVRLAVGADGFLGWVQGVGKSPGDSQPVTAASTADFGVGAFLMAASEVARLTS